MAVVKCKECGGQVSSTAAACPSCGAKPPKKTGVFTWIVAGFFALVVVSMVVGNGERNKEAERAEATRAALEAAKTPEQKQAEAAGKAKREAEFQRVLAVAQALKAGTKNPKSFELVSAIYMPDSTVCLSYRGTNSFNAVVLSSTAIDAKGRRTDWNEKCANKTGLDYAHVRQLL